MWRRSLMLAAAPLLALVWMQALLVEPTEAQAGGPFCQPGEVPTFVYGIAELQRRLGATMGVPTECEHVDPTSGDTLQRTTTGLAYHRPSLNTSMFTDGSTHWALADGTPKSRTSRRRRRSGAGRRPSSAAWPASASRQSVASSTASTSRACARWSATSRRLATPSRSCRRRPALDGTTA